MDLTLDRLAARAGQLYSLPAVAMKVLELTNNPRVDTRALKDCIENDPALTGKILRVVNSSLFGLSRQVSDLNQALALLGTKPLKLLVLGFSLPGGLFAGVAGEVLGRYWRHALTKAVAGRETSETLWNTPGDDAFIAGLLQDLGMLLLIQELGEPYVKLLERVFLGGKDLAALETEVLGFDHTDLSARLLAHWGLPEPLVEAVAWNAPRGAEEATQTGDTSLARILHLAELMARLLADRQPAALAELLRVGREYCQLSREQLESLVATLEEKVDQLAEVFKLQLPEGLDYRDVLAQAHAQLSSVASQAAVELLRGQRGAEDGADDEESLLADMQQLSQAAARLSRRPVESPSAPAAAAAVAAAEPDRGGRPYLAPSGAGESIAADPDLPERLQLTVAACRRSRCPLSLLLVELDRIDELVTTWSRPDFAGLQRFVETICRTLDHPCKICLPHGRGGFALVLPNCERKLAVELGNQLIDAVQRAVPRSADGGRKAVSLRVGVATVALPPRNFRPEDLLVGASRCLYGSHASGGGVVKSIEIY